MIPLAPQVETLIEFSHRLTAGLSLILVIAACIWAFRIFPRKHPVRALSALSVLFLFAEALLGAGLVLFQYVAHDASAGRAIYLAAHLTNTLLLLATLAATAWYAFPNRPLLQPRLIPWHLWATLPAAILVCVTGSIAALGDTLFPASSLGAGLRADFSPAANFLLRLRILHPFLACSAGLFFAAVAFFFLRIVAAPVTRKLALAVILLTLCQLGLGFLNLALLAPAWIQIVHLLLADGVWIALILLTAETAQNPLFRRP